MPRSPLLLPSPPVVLHPGDPAWPVGLSDLSDPPARLRVVGRLPRLEGAIAVVGTRYADDEALAFAHELGRALAVAGRAVISGGARGVDAAAHRGALDGGGPTVAVLATGFERPYPPGHGPLFAEIASGGALVSERDDDSPPLGWAFLARNRLIAALAEAVVVVQAPARSGALSTAALASRLNKPVFAVPYTPWQVRGEGCLGLLQRGARICTSVRDVLSVRPHRGGPGPEPVPDQGENRDDFNDLDEDGRAVLGALAHRPCHPDELSAALGLPIARVQHALLQLLLAGLAVERGHGTYARNLSPDKA